MIKRLSFVFLLSLLLLAGFNSPSASQGDTVYIIPIEGTIDGGMAAFVNRAYSEAEANGATRVILEIDTPGGRIDSAVEVGQTIMNSTVPSIAYVRGGAISAGVLITLSAPDVVMSPGSTIGAAEPRMGEEKADEKTVSYWTKQLQEAAEVHGRDKEVAGAMSDADIAIPGVVDKGKLLTLTSAEALELGIADILLATRQEVIDHYELTEANIVETRPGLAENIASLVTNPYISPILLTIGFYGLLMEVYSAGWGVPGTMGIVALSLFFGGHLIAGFAGIEAILLFIGGVIMLAMEVFVTPGFGIFGIGGIAALIASIFVASVSTQQAMISLTVVLVGTIVLFVLTFRFISAGKYWRSLVLGDKLDAERGYSSANSNLLEYLGREGV
ncbi:MAG: ATP-dependent Clp protease proteolytic subunit, partial [Bacillota bacterium]|nr:ATP-dependent Clp protease proteolytic subunit [Bacillota bacterium]